jgi:hypothetical protein
MESQTNAAKREAPPRRPELPADKLQAKLDRELQELDARIADARKILAKIPSAKNGEAEHGIAEANRELNKAEQGALEAVRLAIETCDARLEQIALAVQDIRRTFFMDDKAPAPDEKQRDAEERMDCTARELRSKLLAEGEGLQRIKEQLKLMEARMARGPLVVAET